LKLPRYRRQWQSSKADGVSEQLKTPKMSGGDENSTGWGVIQTCAIRLKRWNLHMRFCPCWGEGWHANGISKEAPHFSRVFTSNVPTPSVVFIRKSYSQVLINSSTQSRDQRESDTKDTTEQRHTSVLRQHAQTTDRKSNYDVRYNL
jgi:hypothetical protein